LRSGRRRKGREGMGVRIKIEEDKEAGTEYYDGNVDGA
jgi:hypothetical protein